MEHVSLKEKAGSYAENILHAILGNMEVQDLVVRHTRHPSGRLEHMIGRSLLNKNRWRSVRRGMHLIEEPRENTFKVSENRFLHVV